MSNEKNLDELIKLGQKQFKIIQSMIPNFYKNDPIRFKGTVKEFFDQSEKLILENNTELNKLEIIGNIHETPELLEKL